MSNHAGPAAPLRHDAARPRHDRDLFGGRQQQSSAAMGRRRKPARHQSDRGCRSGAGRAAGRARHGADGGRLRQGAAQGAARRGDAGRLDDRPRRQAAHRCQARRRGPSSPDRRLQGLRLEPDHRAPRRRAQSRGVRAGRDRLRQGARQGDQHRSCHLRALDRRIRAGGAIQAPGRCHHSRHARARRLPGVERIWLPGEQSHLKRLDRRKNGVPMPKPLRDSLDALARDLGIAPLG